MVAAPAPQPDHVPAQSRVAVSPGAWWWGPHRDQCALPSVRV